MDWFGHLLSYCPIGIFFKWGMEEKGKTLDTSCVFKRLKQSLIDVTKFSDEKENVCDKIKKVTTKVC